MSNIKTEKVKKLLKKRMILFTQNEIILLQIKRNIIISSGILIYELNSFQNPASPSGAMSGG